ncbi:MAG: HPP family protein [Roseateles asaccharophilus]|uniref:CBS domain-containing protein n=1 Tax=Roseateles asaccharophilus TaxID=582607 RepID=A0A4R6N2E6_9BURK|nr:CBS domain-containing protein [Roseateles asaccharophilus]MDN3544149.1 CBS domain-containing protein [Roseateles asaccharophilus]TDP09257.1 CBS domain-containing protein [Roseateles asaccharophilus]
MFAVYGLQGRLYSGPLDRVRELGAVQAVARLRALAPVQQQDEPDLAERLAAREPGPARGGGVAASSPALAAYAQAAGTDERQPLSLVHQLMSRKLVTVPLAATVGQAWSLLARARVGQAPVLDPAGSLVGLISRADLLRDDRLPAELAEIEAWQARLAAPVAALMWSPVPSAQPDTGVREAAQLLLELRLPGLPVLDEQGVLQGFLSRSDLLRALTHEPPLDLWS